MASQAVLLGAVGYVLAALGLLGWKLRFHAERDVAAQRRSHRFDRCRCGAPFKSYFVPKRFHAPCRRSGTHLERLSAHCPELLGAAVVKSHVAQPPHSVLFREDIRDERVRAPPVKQRVLPETLRDVAQHAPDIPDRLARRRMHSLTVRAGVHAALVKYSPAFSADHSGHLRHKLSYIDIVSQITVSVN